MNTNTASVPRFSIRRLAQTVVRDTTYLFCSFWIALAALVVTMIALSMAGSVVLIPVSILIVLVGVRATAEAERRLQRRTVDPDVPQADYPERDPRDGFLKSLLKQALDPTTWFDVGWGLVGWAISMVTWIVTVGGWCTAITALLYPLFGWALPADTVTIIPPSWVNDDHTLKAAANCVLGVVLLILLPFVLRGLAKLQSMLFGTMLAGAVRERQVEQLRGSVDAGRRAEGERLNRLERDIHDGPQQRLVRLKMDLARAERRLGPDHPESVSLRSAVANTQEILDELRALSKGIAPPVLNDLGLVAAVEDAAARATVPTSVHSDLTGLEGRPLPQHVERAAYFVVTEALTNVAKHAQATSTEVSLGSDHGDLVVDVVDNGVGGADATRGSGLRGLDDRVRSVGGVLLVESPAGGPTRLHARLPIDS